jgi:hypothetical protein
MAGAMAMRPKYALERLAPFATPPHKQTSHKQASTTPNNHTFTTTGGLGGFVGRCGIAKIIGDFPLLQLQVRLFHERFGDVKAMLNHLALHMDGQGGEQPLVAPSWSQQNH